MGIKGLVTGEGTQHYWRDPRGFVLGQECRGLRAGEVYHYTQGCFTTEYNAHTNISIQMLFEITETYIRTTYAFVGQPLQLRLARDVVQE